MISAMRQLARDESAATLVEYGLVLALIALVCIGVLTTLGHNVSTVFSSAAHEL